MTSSCPALRNGADILIFTATRSLVRDAGEIVVEVLMDIIA